jgi:hypothetical protein
MALGAQARWTRWFTWFGPPKRNTLGPQRGLLYCYVWCCFSLELNLPKRACLNLSSTRFFYSSRSDSYSVTQGPTGGPRMVESLLQQLGH